MLYSHCTEPILFGSYVFIGRASVYITLCTIPEAAVRRFSSKVQFLKFRNVLSKTPLLDFLFNKVAKFFKIVFFTEQHRTIGFVIQYDNRTGKKLERSVSGRDQIDSS